MKINAGSHRRTLSLSGSIHAIDEVLRRLAKKRDLFPGRSRFLNERIDSTLDERLRLMRIRDAIRPKTFLLRNPDGGGEEPPAENAMR